MLCIPKGKATSYSELARACGTSPRAIGRIMKHNPNTKKYPCYKVVCADGTLGGYSGGGSKAMKLRKEGIPVVGNRIPNFQNYFFSFAKMAKAAKNNSGAQDPLIGI